LRCIVVDLLIYCDDLALHEQFLDDSGRNNFHLVSQLLDGQHFRNNDGLDLLLLFLLFVLGLLKLVLGLLFLSFALCLPLVFIAAVIFLLVVILSFSFGSLGFLSLQSRCGNGCVLSGLAVLAVSKAAAPILTAVTPVVTSVSSVTVKRPAGALSEPSV